jgi:hypothetical protein
VNPLLEPAQALIEQIEIEIGPCDGSTNSRLWPTANDLRAAIASATEREAAVELLMSVLAGAEADYDGIEGMSIAWQYRILAAYDAIAALSREVTQETAE